ncbi:MAG TPA: NTP transferase domain-containing protein [Gaiellales bacterium]|jgi:CTP:molybdopterin cytidylyltransferase MocA|nr:NTP transferase domain-containing protein [Gaiellales bacterium]
MTLAVVVLAAGAGTRYGGAKQLHPVAGRPMLERVLAAARDSGIEERVVVLGAHAESVLGAVDLQGARAVVSDRWRAGQAGSLTDGLAAVEGEAALVVLGDGPELDSEALRRVAAARMPTRPEEALAADYGAGRSHPVLLPRPVWAALPLTGETPGRSIPVRLVDCSDLRPPGDVDHAD